MERRKFIYHTGLLGAGNFLFPSILRAGLKPTFPDVRIPKSERKFTSPAIERVITSVQKSMKDPEMCWLFGNCFPNTLDTTVDFETKNGRPDTYVITGDIDAMWLRDSSAQVWPYLPFMSDDKNLQQLIKGVINRQVQCILLDPYANAFYKDPNKVSEWKKTDHTEMKAGIHERKWEIDSLCYPIRLAYGYWKKTGDISVFDVEWLEAMKQVVKTFKEQQRLFNDGPYHFERTTSWATDGVPLSGYGYPTRKIGLIHSMFRPSDDATVFPFLIPSNLFALRSLTQLQELLSKLPNYPADLMANSASLCKALSQAIEEYGIIQHKEFGKIYAYEVNGFGSYHLMDDANVPSLLGLPYLNAVKRDDPVYENTRRYVLSSSNPFYFRGTAAEGIGGPHAGMDYIWPMSIIMRALTSTDTSETDQCLQWLKTTHAGTGFMHESFHKDDPSKFTRKWFAWANTLFGELVLNHIR